MKKTNKKRMSLKKSQNVFMGKFGSVAVKGSGR